MRSEDFILGITMSLIILSGVALLITAMINRRKMREMEHRERLAMIERGLMPSPESDPGAFEAAAGFALPPEEPGVGYRSAGVLMIGFGIGLMLLIGVLARSARVGIGIGGVWAIIGAASLVNYYLIARHEEERGQRLPWTPPVRKAPGPPPNVGP
jgi:uncharacterized protein DUF6249